MIPVRSDILNLIEENYDRLSELKKDHALVLRRLYLEGKTKNDVAHELGVEIGGVKCRTRTALIRFRSLVTPEQESPLYLVKENQHRLDELERGQALILRRRFLEGKTLTQVATELSRGVSTIFNRQRTALDIFRRLVDPNKASPSDQVEKNQSRLIELNNDQALILRWRFLEGKSRKEVGNNLGLAKTSVMHRERAALYRLRNLVSSGEPSSLHLVKENRTRLNQLRESHASVLRRRFLEGKTQKETARELGITKRAVCNRARAGLDSLRTLVSNITNTGG